jgi:LacI family transcriptional regulator
MARRRQAVTIKHVAADAGVSLQTVSRVINNESSVRPTLKEHVQASIDKLGYVPSIAAQRMSGSKSYLILAINDRARTIADWHARQGRDWVDQMLLGGMLKCAEHGYRMIFELIDTHNDHVERELSAAIAALQPDGIILTPPHSENQLIVDLLVKRNIRFARIGSLQMGQGIAMTMGDEASAHMATEHLIHLGHKRIGFIAGPEELGLSQWRIAGWKAALNDAGLEDDQLMVRGDFSHESGVEGTSALMALCDPPTAIIASNDQMALGALDKAIQLGLKVPDDVSLVSFDNSPVMRFTTPQLTAIDQPIAETFAKAVELLIAKVDSLEDAQPVVLQSRLVVRASTASPRLLYVTR